MTLATHLILIRRPGVTLEHNMTELIETELDTLQDGTFRVYISHLTLDVSMIGWMRDGRSYVPNISLGETIRATAVGVVEESRHEGFSNGELVTGLFAVATHFVSDGSGVVKLKANVASAEEWAGSLGLTTAFTSFVGMDFAAQDLSGKTVLVSGASGLVGGFAAQFARLRGGRVIGIAGGEEACRQARQDLGIDHCIDYKAPQPIEEVLQEVCSERIDVFYDNVGGQIYDAALGWMNTFGTVIMCGQTAERGLQQPPAVLNIRTMIMERLNMRGFVVFDHPEVFSRAAAEIARGISTGQMRRPHLDICHDGGLAAFHEAYDTLLQDKQKGKHILKV